MKQEVIVPKDYTSLGVQLQYFVGAIEIFFGSDSIATLEMRRLLLQVGRNKKQFRDMIALDEWFAARFLLAIDKRFQRWLNECKKATVSRSDVNDRILDFSDVIEMVLNGTFTMPLPPSFQKVNSEDATDKRSGDNLVKEGSGKKQKSDKKEKKDSAPVKNNSQHDSFKMKAGETWKKTFKSAHADSRPSWNGEKTKKMCIRWHIHGECFESCDRKESHVPKEDIPADKVVEMCTFIAKCRGE